MTSRTTPGSIQWRADAAGFKARCAQELKRSFPATIKDHRTRNALSATTLQGKELGLAQRNGNGGSNEMADPRQEDKSTQSIKDAARSATEKTAEQASRIGQVAGDAGKDAARVGANLLQQNAETLQNTWRLALEAATAAMGRSTDQLSRTAGLLSGNETQQATERSARNAETVLYATTAATKVVDGMSREYFEMVRHQAEKSMGRMNELWSCRNPHDLAAIQSDLMRETVGSFLESSRRMADMSLKLVDDATKHMTENMERTRRAS
jgi:hypothetical protein